MLLATIPPHKEELKGIIEYLTYQMKLLNVEVHLGKQAGARDVVGGGFDEVVLAVGG